MLCSDCNKNAAILFFDKIENGKSTMEGLCADCAQKRGINAIDVLNRQKDILGNTHNQSTSNVENNGNANLNNINMQDMSKQFETIFKDLAENINLEDIENIEGAFTFGPSADGMDEEDEDAPKIAGAAIPLGSIFNMFGAKKENASQAQFSNNGSYERKKVKVEKKKSKQSKKKKYLDTYGTNLTNKALNNELDIVIGRDKEIQRITQILNRRSKNNPCLIGEPGVGKTAIAQGLAIKIANQNVPAKLLNKEV